MSAFLCNPQHIGLLARFEPNRMRHTPAEQQAEILAKANLVSVSARYRLSPDAVGAEFGAGHSAESYIEACKSEAGKFGRRLLPIEALKMAQCSNYQSCEVEGWSETPAYALLHRIMGQAISELPGYDAAPWEYVAA
jgi:hypothetical protein